MQTSTLYPHCWARGIRSGGQVTRKGARLRSPLATFSSHHARAQPCPVAEAGADGLEPGTSFYNMNLAINAPEVWPLILGILCVVEPQVSKQSLVPILGLRSGLRIV